MSTLRKRIKHNDLLPWFLENHGTLPASYLKSCEKFFKSLKPQAPSGKLQASSLTKKNYNVIVSHKLKEKVK
tara:strand:+ start:442 stop:657 length:216 start_codon:yes stop_codon:yes gene_type:complete